MQALEPNSFPSVDIPYLQMMINWHHLDPVSQKEIDRNNAAYTYQKNRNPFIDHPEYVGLTWNGSCPGLGTLPVDIIYFYEAFAVWMHKKFAYKTVFHQKHH